METLIVIIVVIMVVGIHFILRDRKVYDFSIGVNNKCHDVLRNFLYSLKDDKERNERYEEYKQLKIKRNEILLKHSYWSMLFSLKQLKLEQWYTKEEIEFMNLKFYKSK